MKKIIKYLFLLFFLFFPTTIAISSYKILEKKYKIAVIFSNDIFSYNDRLSYWEEISFLKNNGAIIREYFLESNYIKHQFLIEEKSKKIESRIKEFDPDFFLIFGNSAFKYFAIPLINKNNNNFIALDLDFDKTLELIKKYDIKKENISLIVNNLNFSGINNELKNIFINKVYLIKNNLLIDDPIVENLKLQIKFEKEEYVFSNLNELERIIKEIQNKPNGLIIYLLPEFEQHVFDKNTLVKILLKNKKHLELSIGNNISELSFNIRYKQNNLKLEKILEKIKYNNNFFLENYGMLVYNKTRILSLGYLDILKNSGLIEENIL